MRKKGINLIIMLFFILSPFLILYGCAYTKMLMSGESSEILLKDDDIAYYNNIKEDVKASNSDEINLSEIFDFDWDRAYIAKRANGEGEEFYKEIDSQSLPVYDERDGIKYIIFLKGKKFVYIYDYISTKTNFMPEDIFFSKKNAIFKIIQKPKWFHNKIILELKE